MIIMVGASASGKTEIAKLLISNYHFTKMITYTTREKRTNEINHVDYHFISLTEFESKKEKGEFLETSSYNNNLYGTAFKDAEDDRVLIVEPEGANHIFDRNLSSTAFFYLEASDEIRRNRMLQRGDDIIDIENRISMDKERFKRSNLRHIDYIIDTSILSLDELANQIFNLYHHFLNQDKTQHNNE